MRCIPRRKKQFWILFLLAAFLFGVYISYNHLTDGGKFSHGLTSLPYNPQLEKTHKRLREKAQAELLKAKSGSKIGNKGYLGKDFPEVEDNAALVHLRALETDDDYITPDEMLARFKILLIDLHPTNWKSTPDVEDMILQVKSELYDLGIESQLSCKQIIALKPGGFNYRSHYGKKSVERLQVNYFNSVVVKSPGKDSQLKIQCMQMDYNEARCSAMSNYKMLRELVYMLVLKSPSVIPLKGFCLRGDIIDARLHKKGVMVVTEAGDAVSMHTLRHFPRQTKLEIAEAMLKFLLYMENSPVGSLGFEQLHLEDFVIFGTDLKLVDLDNIHIGELVCTADKDCVIPEMSRKVIKCHNNLCQGRNAMNNLLWFYRIILQLLLLPSPPKYEMEVSKALDNTQNLEITAQELLVKLTRWKEDPDAMLNVLGAKDFHSNHIPDGDNGVWRESQNRKVKPNNMLNMDNRIYADQHDDRKVRPNNMLENDNTLFGDNHDDRKVHPNSLLEKDDALFGDKQGERKRLKKYPTPKPPYLVNNEHVTPARLPIVEKIDLPQDVEYIREDHANYPGLYDYFCDNSRVSWGCVKTIHSIDEGKSLCNSDLRCECFVIFSTNPNISAVMTAIFKNSAKGQSDYNKGTTLFAKKRSRERGLTRDQGVQVTNVPFEVVKPSPQADIPSCVNKFYNQTVLGRVSREKRLMTHLGLKGISEDEWSTFAKMVKIVRSQGLSQMSHKLVTGARLKVVYDTNALGLKKGEFLLEKGPTHHHVSFMIAYYLDRLLGLYHVPPAVRRVLSWNDIQDITGDKKFQELYMKFNESEALHGVITLPVPPVMKTEKFTISNQDAMVTRIQPYTRAEKSQLEYILIWALMKFQQPSHGFLGYKGHFIHFEADVGFGNMKKLLQGYFYNCQFPNPVFKTLLCYKCATSQKVPKICGLGQEVMKQVKNSGFSSLDLQIGKYKERHLADIINNNAATLLSAVEHCIKTFSREKVLY